MNGSETKNTLTTSGSMTSQRWSGHPVRVVTFDLDNTLWNTGATISAANDVLAKFLDQFSIQQPKRIEHIMKDLFQQDKAKYAPLLDVETETANAHPVLLTQLRKDALLQILVQDNGYNEQKAEELTEQAFQKVRLTREK